MQAKDVAMKEEDQKKISEFLVLNETIKRLDKDKKRLTEEVKDIFEQYKITDPLEHDGSTLTVTEKVRKTVTKSTKDKFIMELINKGKNYLVMQSVDVDVDTIYTEYQNGTIDKDFVDQYVKITPEKALTVK
jgi:hypothetical protein